MTNEQKQAIDILKQRECCRECVVYSGDCNACDEAFKMAIEAISTTDVIEREKVAKDMKKLYDDVYYLVKTENWDKEKEVESKIISQALDIIINYVEKYSTAKEIENENS